MALVNRAPPSDRVPAVELAVQGFRFLPRHNTSRCLLGSTRWCTTRTMSDAVGLLDVEEQMAPDVVGAVALADRDTGTPAARIRRDALDRCAVLGDVLLSVARARCTTPSPSWPGRRADPQFESRMSTADAGGRGQVASGSDDPGRRDRRGRAATDRSRLQGQGRGWLGQLS